MGKWKQTQDGKLERELREDKAAAKRNKKLNSEDFEKEAPCQSSPLYSANLEAAKQPA